MKFLKVTLLTFAARLCLLPQQQLGDVNTETPAPGARTKKASYWSVSISDAVIARSLQWKKAKQQRLF